MAKKSNHGVMDADSTESTNGVETAVREMLPSVNLKPLMERAQVLMQENPGAVLGAAVGTGFILGVTLFSKVGRLALAGILGLGAEVALQKIRMNYLEGDATA